MLDLNIGNANVYTCSFDAIKVLTDVIETFYFIYIYDFFLEELLTKYKYIFFLNDYDLLSIAGVTILIFFLLLNVAFFDILGSMVEFV